MMCDLRGPKYVMQPTWSNIRDAIYVMQQVVCSLRAIHVVQPCGAPDVVRAILCSLSGIIDVVLCMLVESNRNNRYGAANVVRSG
eukprot:5415640-Pyramimonas_sp.AAC.1